MKTTDIRLLDSLKFKLLFWICSAITVISFGFGVLNYAASKADLLKRQEREMTALRDRLQQSLPQALWNLDMSQVQAALQAEAGNPDLLSIDVYDNAHKWLFGMRSTGGTFQVDTSEAPADASASESADIQYGDAGQKKLIGSLRARFDSNAIEAAQNHLLYRLVGQTLLLELCIVGLTGLIVQRTLLGPLNALQTAMGAIANGEADLTKRLSSSGNDEFALLSRSFNRFLDTLQALVLNIRKSTSDASVAAKEIAEGNHDISSRTEHQAAAIQEAVVTTSNLADSVRSNAQTAREVSDTAAQTQLNAQEGRRNVGSVVDAMKEIHRTSLQIGEIIGVINSIAFQTNILALNAAVESARAGAEGKGFAVVAHEVRGLASRVATAAKEVKVLIDAAVNSAQIGNVQVEQAASTIDSVTAGVCKVTDLMQNIAQSSESQMNGIMQIDAQMHAIDTNIQQNAALVEQSAAASTGLSTRAWQLLEQISRFKVDG